MGIFAQGNSQQFKGSNDATESGYAPAAASMTYGHTKTPQLGCHDASLHSGTSLELKLGNGKSKMSDKQVRRHESAGYTSGPFETLTLLESLNRRAEITENDGKPKIKNI